MDALEGGNLWKMERIKARKKFNMIPSKFIPNFSDIKANVFFAQDHKTWTSTILFDHYS